MKGITPCLWLDSQAEEIVRWYTSLFENSHIGAVTRFEEAAAKASGNPVGSVMTVEFTLHGQAFLALNGSEFQFTPALSLSVNCDSREEIERLWAAFSDGGQVLMELKEYPFSKQYGWVQDKYGLSWQLNLGNRAQKITPTLLFVGDKFGKAEEAMNFYISRFPDSRILNLYRYERDEGGEEGKVKYAEFSLNGQEFIAMESNLEHGFRFTLAISFMVNCENQAEVDKYWDSLSADGGKPSVCGWLEDKYGISWQVVPTLLMELHYNPDPAVRTRVMEAMLTMSKLDIAALEDAAAGVGK